MNRFTRPLLVAACLSLAAPAAGQTLGIGIAAPTSGPSEILGRQVLAGAREAAKAAGDVSLTEVDTECSVDGGRTAARRFVDQKVRLVVGFLCSEALDGALPDLSAAGIPAIVVGVRADRVTDDRKRSKTLVWRVAPRSDASAKAAAAFVASRWSALPFGILDDGSLEGRALSDAVRAGVEAAGLKPALLDSFRPAEEKQFGLVRRIAASGVTHLFISGDRPDVAIILRDAAENGLALEVAGSESLLDEPGPVPLAAGVLVVAPRWQADAAETVRPEEREGYFGPALTATTIAAEALRRAGTGSRALSAILDGDTFPTPLGPVRFDAKGDANPDVFDVFRFDGTDFQPDAGG